MSSFKSTTQHLDRFAVMAAGADSVFNQEIGERLRERLALVRIDPARVLDLGCGVGTQALALQKMYPKTRVFGLDQLLPMALRTRKQRRGWRRPLQAVAGSASLLPFPDESFELVFSSLMLHWADDQPAVMSEIARLLKPEAPAMFSCYGPDTLMELSSIGLSVPGFVDMHDLGDALLAAGLADPVMEMEKVHFSYRSSAQLAQDLIAAGLLLSKETAALAESVQITEQAPFCLTIEVVYGHAWKPAKTPDMDGFKGIKITPMKSPLNSN